MSKNDKMFDHPVGAIHESPGLHLCFCELGIKPPIPAYPISPRLRASACKSFWFRLVRLRLCEHAQSRLQCVAIVDGQGLLVGINTLVQTRQHFARRAFDVVSDAVFAKFQHGFNPAHR